MTEDAKAILTDEEMEQLRETAKEVNKDNDSINKLQEAKEKSIDELLDSKEEERNIVMNTNPMTGMPEGVSVASGYGLDSESDLFEDLDDIAPDEDELNRDFSEKEIGKVLENDIHHDEPTIADIAWVKQLLERKNEKGSIKYSDLPKFLKERVDHTVRSEMAGFTGSQIGMARNMMADSIIEEVYTSILQERINEVSIDLETSIKNLVKHEYSDINSSQHKQYHQIYMKNLPELADGKYKDDPEKRKMLLAVSAGYKQAHTLEEMYSAYSKGGSLMKIKKIEIEKLHKVIKEFEMKYENSTFTIRDINYAVDTLKRHVNPRYPENVIKGFIVVFCKYTRNMKPSNVANHTFMYYFINNILALDIPTTDKEVESYNKRFIENVNHFLKLIDDKLNHK